METPSNRGQDFVAGAEQSKDQEPFLTGVIEVEGRELPWELVLSRGQSVTDGTHLNFVCYENRLTKEEVIALGTQATRIAEYIAPEPEGEDSDYRFSVNRGKRASTITEGYHAHIVFFGEGDVPARLVANVQKIIDDSDVPDEKKQQFRDKLLQKKPTV